MVRPLGINGSIFEDYESGIALKDIFKMSREWVPEVAGNFSFLSASGGPITVDANGNQTLSAGQRAGTIMCRDLQVSGVDAAALYPTGDYVCTYTGTGRIIIGFDGVPLAYESGGLWAQPQSAGRIEFTVPAATNAGIYLGIDEQNAGDPIRNIKVFRKVFEGTLVSNPWDPAFLLRLAPFSIIRTMNWQRINISPESTWANRATTSFVRYTTRKGMPIELLIDLANRTDKKLWFCIPHKATDAYVTSFGQLVNSTLNANLGCRIEWSNEVWNDTFKFVPGGSGWPADDAQTEYAEAQGLALGLDTNAYQARIKFYSRRSRQTINIFRNQFANPSRVKRYLCFQHEGDESNCNTFLDFESAYASADGYATAAYWGYACGDSSNADNMVTCMQSNLDGGPTVRLADQSARAAARGLEFGQYEFGTSPFSILGNVAQVPIIKSAVYDARMIDQYAQMFAAMEAANVVEPCAYSICTKGAVSGFFGHLRRLDESPDPPRWQALLAYANQTNVTPTNPGSQALVEASIGFDFADNKYKWFAGPQAKTALGGTVLDFVGPKFRTYTMAADTVFTVTNALRGSSMVLELQGNFRVRFPSSFRITRGRYDGSNGQLNRVAIYCQEHSGTPIYEVQIETLPAASTGLILRQNLVVSTPSTLFSTWADVLSTPSATPASANKYSRLAEMEQFRSRGGYFNFRLVWPLLSGTDSNPLYLAFRQLTSPLEPISRERVIGYQLLTHNLVNAIPYGGLCRTSVLEAFFSTVPGSTSLATPFIAMSRWGLEALIAGGANLIPHPNIGATSRIELYADPDS